MQTLLRLTLLGIFGAAGVGIAISVATQTPPAGDEGPVSSLEAEAASDAAQSDKNTPNVSRPEGTQTPAGHKPVPSVSPLTEPYGSPVASKIEQLEDRMRQMQSEKEQERMRQLESKLRDIERAAENRQHQFEKTAFQQQHQIEKASREQRELITQLAQAVREGQSQPAPLDPAIKVAGIGPEIGQLQAASSVDEAEDQKDENADDAESAMHRGEGDEGLSLNLRNEDLRQVLEFLSAEGKLNILATESVQGTVTATLNNVDVKTALESILRTAGYKFRQEGNFVYVGEAVDFEKMDQLSDQIGTRIYRTNYVTAAELQQLVAPMITPTVGVITVSTKSKVDIPADSVTTGGDDFAGNEVLLVRDYERVLQQVDEVVMRIDRQPSQVSIEAVILSVALDDTASVGIDFEVLRNRANIRLIGNSPIASLAAIDTSGGGLNIGFLDGGMSAFIKALESFGDTDVIVSPHLLCLNKQRAEILIGDQKGYLSTTQTETATTQTVEFLDIGTQLRVRPFISDDGMIRLEVHPELSTGDVRLLGDFALPEKSTTQVTTNIMCRDGRTVVIGGLIREDIAETVTRVAGLGSIPVVGALFRSKTHTVIRNEIIVLLTPRIIREAALCDPEGESLKDLPHRQAVAKAAKMTVIGRHYYSERYFRLGQQAWRAGNVHVALNYLDLALYFHAKNKRAIKLQAMILSHDHGPPNLVEGPFLNPDGTPIPYESIESMEMRSDGGIIEPVPTYPDIVPDSALPPPNALPRHHPNQRPVVAAHPAATSRRSKPVSAPTTQSSGENKRSGRNKRPLQLPAFGRRYPVSQAAATDAPEPSPVRFTRSK